MKRLAKYVVTFAATALMSSSAFAAITYSEDFETYDVVPGDGLLHHGWKVFGNVFDIYPECTGYLWGHGPWDAPNSYEKFSNITDLGSSGLALNVFSDYTNGDHATKCVESNVFQEITFDAADAGNYTFSYDIELPPDDLGPGVKTYAFVKVINNVDPWNTLLVKSVPTTSAGRGSINVSLDGTEHGGKILQWGFTVTASGVGVSTGRWYDNLSFAPQDPSTIKDDPLGVPIPLWALFGMGGLIAFVGGMRLRTRRKA